MTYVQSNGEEQHRSHDTVYNYLQALHIALAHENDPAKRQQIEVGLISKWLTEDAQGFFRQLRRERPVFTSSFLTLVTRYNDVVDVLNSNDVFTVDNISAKLIANVGDNVLAMNDSPKYEHKKSLLRLAFQRADMVRYRRIVIEVASQLLATVGIAKPFDLTNEYALKVPAIAMARFLGMGELPEDKLVSWTHALFHEIFLNPQNDPASIAAARAVREEANPLIDAIIAARKKELAKSGAPSEPTLIDRYLLLQAVPETYESDEAIRDVALGLMMGCVDLSGGGIVNAVVELMRRPQILREALRVARVEDDSAITAYTLEALRFRPPSNGVTSYCAKDYVVGRGTPYATLIPAGTLVMACSASAMQDPEHIDAPTQFRPGRLPSKNYLFWESGLHTCHGRHAAQLHITLAVKYLLRAGLPDQVDPFPVSHGYPQQFRVRLVPAEG